MLVLLALLVGIPVVWDLFTRKYLNPYKLYLVFGKKGSGKSTYRHCLHTVSADDVDGLGGPDALSALRANVLSCGARPLPSRCPGRLGSVRRSTGSYPD